MKYIYISLLLRYARARPLYLDYVTVFDRSSTLLCQGYFKEWSHLVFQNCFHLFEKYSVTCEQMTKDGIGN